MSPISTYFAGLSARALGFAGNLRSRVYDSFSRTNSGPLGTANTGQIWNAITGVWSAAAGVAQTATSPSSYPLTTLLFNNSPKLSLANTTPGTGVVFWESDAGDYWAALTSVSETSVITSYNCYSNACCSTYNNCVSNACCTGSNTCVSNWCCTGYYSCPNGSYPILSGSNCYQNPSIGHAYIAATFTCVSNACCTGSNTCVSNACCTGCPTCGCTSNSCCTSSPNYTYTWTFLLKIIQSVSSTLSTIVSTNVATYSNTTGTGINQILSMTLGVVGAVITASAFSDNAFTTLLGTVTTAAGSVPSANNVGIILGPVDSTASAMQGTTVGPFTAQ